MHTTIDRYFILVYSISFLFALSKSLLFGLVYFIPLSVCLLLLLDKKSYWSVFTSFALWLSALLRPLILFNNPDYFGYKISVGSISNSLIIQSLIELGLLYYCFYFGFVLSRKKIKISKKLVEHGFLISKNKDTILNFIIILYSIYLILMINFQLGIVGANPGPIGIIINFMPLIFIYPILVLYIIKYKNFLNIKNKYQIIIIVSLMLVSGILSGSKAFIAFFLFAIFVYKLYFGLNEGIKFSYAVISLIVGGGVILFSFTSAMIVRYTMMKTGISFELFNESIYSINRVIEVSDISDYLNAFTFRLNSFDGYMVTKMVDASILKDIFSIPNTLARVFNQLVPFSSGESGMTSGRAIAVYIENSPLNVSHSGAIGLFGYFSIMGGSFSFVSVFIFGTLLNFLFKIENYFNDSDKKFLSRFLLSYFFLNTLISGNLDLLLSGFIIAIINLIFYSKLLNITVR